MQILVLLSLISLTLALASGNDALQALQQPILITQPGVVQDGYVGGQGGRSAARPQDVWRLRRTKRRNLREVEDEHEGSAVVLLG